VPLRAPSHIWALRFHYRGHERLVGIPPLRALANDIQCLAPTFEIRSTLPPFFSTLTMPTPKFLRRFSPKGSSGNAHHVDPGATPTIRKGETTPETPTIADLNTPQYSDAMNEAWDAANAKLPQAHGLEKFLNSVGALIVSVPQPFCAKVDEEKVQNAATLSDGQQAVVTTLAAPAKALMDAPRIADDIEKGVNTFMETVPVLMKALDEVAKVHPFIAGMGESVPNVQVLIGDLLVAVTAFKAVYTLEVTRRNNDQKIIALYAEYVARTLPRRFTLLTNLQNERYNGGPHSVCPPINRAAFACLNHPQIERCIRP